MEYHRISRDIFVSGREPNVGHDSPAFVIISIKCREFYCCYAIDFVVKLIY